MTTSLDECRDDAAIQRFFERNAALHLYELGDLAEPFRSSTRFYVRRSTPGEIDAIVTLYAGSEPATVLAFAADDRELEATSALLHSLRPTLPDRVYTHLSPGLSDALDGFGARADHGQHLKLVLANRTRFAECSTDGAVALGPENADEIIAFLNAAYPNNFFHSRVLESRMAFGVREASASGDEVLRAFAGLHVLAPKRVAALGNIATDPSVRSRGLARRCVSTLIHALLASGIETIGLNVEADNVPALALYESLGFVRVAPYLEAIYTRS